MTDSSPQSDVPPSATPTTPAPTSASGPAAESQPQPQPSRRLPTSRGACRCGFRSPADAHRLRQRPPCSGRTRPVPGAPRLGVALFFVLSGFLLSRPWVREVQLGARRPSVGRYFKHRLARILPAYWVALIAVLLTTGSGASTRTIIDNVTLTQGYTGRFLPSFFQTWSLVTEVAFYIVLPLLAPLLIRKSKKTSWCCWVRSP